MNKNRDDSIQTETESGSEVPGLVPSGPVNIFQPKLLRLGKFTHTQLNLDEMHKKQSKAIKKKIKEIIKIEKKMQQEERNNYNSRMKEALISFYKNPFKYMDYLIEKYFKGKYEGYDEEALKKVLAHELKKNPDYNFKEKEGIKHTSTITDIKSEPIIQTNIEDVMISEARAKFNTVINTKTDIKDSILNDKYSNLSKENILKQALTCIKGPRIVIPNSNFIQVKDLEECHINKEEMKHATRLFEMERNFEKIKKNSEDLVITHINKTISAEKKIFDEMMSKANEGIQRMEQGGLVSEEVLAYIKSKVDEDFSKECIKLGISKLNIFENNLDDIKKELEKYETADQECMRLQERLRILEENTKLADLKAEKFIEEKTKQAEDEKSFVINDKIIDKLYQRYKPKPKNKKLNLYNDNPFNYNYNYGRNKYSASKVIQPATKINSRFK